MEKYISFIGEYNNESGSSDVTEFTLSIGSAGAKEWNGTVWYSTDTVNWSIWDGSTITSGNKRLYLRGKNNTTFYTTKGACLQLSRKAKCFGNINVLLDYDNPPLNVYDNCYKSLFDGCSNLLRAPSLPATSLAASCYFNMFKGCSSLTDAPELPAHNIPTSAYQYMFQNCTSLTKLPILPAQTVASKGYYGMFYGCSLIKVSATKTGDYKTNWKMPSDVTSVSFAADATYYMLYTTGGTFTGSGASNKVSENTVFYGSWTSEENVFYKTLLKASDFCQLLDKSKYPATKTSNGITFTNNDGVIIVNGTATTTASYSITDIGISVIGHKYLLAGGVNNSCYIDGYISYNVSDVHFGNDIGSGYIFTANVSGMMRVLLRVVTNYAATNVMFKPQLFDLTEMYGAGNEPTTLAEFRQKYPNDLYPYGNNSIFVESYKTNLICNKTNNLFNINNGLIRQARCNGVIENGVATITATEANANYCFAKVDVEVGKTYIVSANWTTTGYSLGLMVSNESSYDTASYGYITETTNSIKIVATGTELYLKGYVTYEVLPAVATISNITVTEIVNITTYKSKIKT